MAQSDENFVAYKGNSTVMKAVNAGQIDGGVIYHYYRLSISPKPVKTAKTPNSTTSNTRIRARL
jgi:ABC-type Fe3+ transport system substrate-binding protein